ncbi:MAG: hypothetical protein Q9167_007129 [Letrouitia subvulpina]
MYLRLASNPSEICDKASFSVNQTSDLIGGKFINGWVHQPNTRGTLDILWDCLVTIFLCTWTVLCLNVPAPSDSQLTIIVRKLRWMAYAIIGPEFVLGAAAGQYKDAQRAVSAFKEMGYPKWTMRHAFFADMGGFMLCPRDSKPFPVNNKHIQWLVTHKFLEFPKVTEEDIWDKSKADRLVKYIVCLQICWLLVNVVARVIQNLAVTTMELGAVSIVFCSIATFFCWLHKPADVRTPICLATSSSTAEILLSAGPDAKAPYRMTPLDFVDNLGPSWSANIMAFAGIRSGPQERPLPRLTNDRFPHVRHFSQFLLIVITLFSDGIHLFGWRFDFPSRAERIVWRIASLQMFCTAAVFWGAELLAVLYRDDTWGLLRVIFTHPSQTKAFRKDRKEMPPPPQPTPETFPLPWECGASTTMWVLYLIARAYVLVEIAGPARHGRIMRQKRPSFFSGVTPRGKRD